MGKTTWSLLTPPYQGAISIIQLEGDVDSELSRLTNRSAWVQGTLHLVNIQDIDEAICVKLNKTLALIMPHGGTHILRKLGKRFEELGIQRAGNPSYPEARDEIEIAMLQTLSIAQSPLATELLLQQPDKLRGATPSEEDIERAIILNRLIYPPKVVLLGMPNTGKSTLMNALRKQETSIVHERPGATRDAVGTRINCAGLMIDLYDLPGFRQSDDHIEQEAINLAKGIAEDAVLTIRIADAESEWLPATQNSLKVCTKSDLSGRDDADICVSAHTGEHLEELCVSIRDTIVPPEMLTSDAPWFFYNPIEE